MSWYFWTIAYTRVQCYENADSEGSAKWKEAKGKPDKSNDLILKTTAELK